MSDTPPAKIASVLFTCEASGRVVQTGHRMRPAEFAAVNGPRSFRCAQCQKIHTWTNETAWLEGVGPAAIAQRAAEAQAAAA